MKAKEEIFQRSFNDILFNPDKVSLFFDRFYSNFIEQDEDVAELFAKTDLQKQSKMLRHSFILILEFSLLGHAGSQLQQLAELHSRRQLNISPKYYEYWINALLKTVAEVNPDTDEATLLAWRTMVTPGVEFMISKYS